MRRPKNEVESLLSKHRHGLTESIGKARRGKIEKRYSSGCLWPRGACGLPVARAHSIQKKGGVLTQLEKDGHVAMLEPADTFDRPHPLRFRLVGLNEASVFEGLCNAHDTELFSPIENGPVDPEDLEHRFLLAYRSVLKQTHTAVVSHRIAQARAKEFGQELSELVRRRPLLAGGHPSIEHAEAVFRVAVQGSREHRSSMEQHKLAHDQAYNSDNFYDLDHKVIKLPAYAGVHLAANSLFSSEKYSPKNSPYTFVALNVLPIDGRTWIVLSYPRALERLVLPVIEQLNEQGKDLLGRVSRMVLRNSETFALKPQFLDSLPEDRQEAIVSYFLKTALDPSYETNDPKISLF